MARRPMPHSNALPRMLIVGAGGMIGSHLTLAFGDKAEIPHGQGLSLGDVDAVRGFIEERGIGLVINAVGASGKNWRTLFEANAFVARTIAKACARAEARCIYLSSTRVFDGASNTPYAEDAAPSPRDDYGLSKFLGERFVMNAMPEGKYHILRLPMVLGVRSGNMQAQIATRLLERARQGQPTAAADDVITQVVHVSDVARAITALTLSDAPAGIYHHASHDEASLHAVISRIFQGLGLAPPRAAKAAEFDAEAGPSRIVLEPGRLSDPRVGLAAPGWREAVERFVEEVRETGE